VFIRVYGRVLGWSVMVNTLPISATLFNQYITQFGVWSIPIVFILLGVVLYLCDELLTFTEGL
jgi:hypothetical protein